METHEHLSRLRRTETLRRLVRETQLRCDDLVQPLFVHHGSDICRPIASLPGQNQLSVDRLGDVARRLWDLGVAAVLLFGIPEKKDAVGSDTWDDEHGIIQQALRVLRAAVPEMLLITDVCFCEYTDHGHCGVLRERDGRRELDHEATRTHLALQALSHARAGADMLAPSGMIDGAVGAIRQALDANDFDHLPVMSYAAKFASGFYGPFRDAAGGAPQFGDRRSHQMDPANATEALREVAQDLREGADLVMVKPAVAYLDIIRRVKDTFAVPTAAYHVSGEYAMIKAAAAQGWLDEKAVVLETLTALKRGGADILITYYAADVATWLA